MKNKNNVEDCFEKNKIKKFDTKKSLNGGIFIFHRNFNIFHTGQSLYCKCKNQKRTKIKREQKSKEVIYIITKYKMGKLKEGSVVPETTKRDYPHLKTPVAEVKGQVFETLSARGGHIGDGELGGVTAGPQHLSITIRRQQIEEENRRDRERRERERRGRRR